MAGAASGLILSLQYMDGDGCPFLDPVIMLASCFLLYSEFFIVSRAA